MDVAALEAALPAEVNAASSLITADAQVHVDEEPRQTGKTDPQVWVRPEGLLDPPAAGLGATGVAYGYTVRLEGDPLTPAQRQTFVADLLTHFHGLKRPAAITNHHRTLVDPGASSLHRDAGEAEAVEALLVFEGEIDHA